VSASGLIHRTYRIARDAPSAAHGLCLPRLRSSTAGLFSYSTDISNRTASCQLRRSHSQRGEARRTASAVADQVRPCDNLKTAKTLGLTVTANRGSLAPTR